ncbi:winged helix-turn-helix transcriptional regulator [Haloplanus rubicundus]|uniref:Winged helix-turn-helix transcriptional regulator n=2 Tax=Haloplanus rubicundus TaxID=1547898 RepID=A0A345E154_9EURY|nr:winged helix-turn-helix transcriptional regulator [Haloplanus rubicundus]
MVNHAWVLTDRLSTDNERMADSTFEYLAGSELRPAVLAVLRAEGPLPLREVADRVSASRRTVKRTLRAMESRGWIRPTNGAYELTALGATVLAAHEEFRERSRIARRLRPFLERVPASEFDPGIGALADATVCTPDDDPTAFVDRLVELRAGATRVREYTPFLMLDSLEQFSEGNGQSDGDVIVVVRTDTPPRSTPAYDERFEALVAAPHAEVYVDPDGPTNIAFGVADGTAFLGVADDDGMPGALLVGDAPELVSWVERQFEDCLDAAEPLPE